MAITIVQLYKSSQNSNID